jgi:uncharacterized membrane protein YeaQ/YmgE (transglycosylase-associated protein family)
MNVIILTAWGGFIGWAAGGFMGTGKGQRLAINVIVGIVGAFLGAWLFGSMGNFSSSGLLSALVGSLALLGVAKLVNLV